MFLGNCGQDRFGTKTLTIFNNSSNQLHIRVKKNVVMFETKRGGHHPAKYFILKKNAPVLLTHTEIYMTCVYRLFHFEYVNLSFCNYH